MKKKTTAFCLTEKILNELKKSSQDTGLSMSDIVRRALEDWFRKEK